MAGKAVVRGNDTPEPGSRYMTNRATCSFLDIAVQPLCQQTEPALMSPGPGPSSQASRRRDPIPRTRDEPNTQVRPATGFANRFDNETRRDGETTRDTGDAQRGLRLVSETRW